MDWWTIPDIGNFSESLDLDPTRYVGSTTQVYLPGSPGSLSYQSWWWGLKSWVGRHGESETQAIWCLVVWFGFEWREFFKPNLILIQPLRLHQLFYTPPMDNFLASLVNVWKPFVQTKMVIKVHIWIHPYISTGFQLDRVFFLKQKHTVSTHKPLKDIHSWKPHGVQSPWVGRSHDELIGSIVAGAVIWSSLTSFWNSQL